MDRVLFNLLLVFLPTQLGLHLWPPWAYVLGRRIDYLSPAVYFTDVLIFFILLFRFPVTRRNLSILIPVGIFAAGNIFFAASPWVAAYKWIKILEFTLLGLYIVETKPAAQRVMFFLSIGVFYSSVLALAQFALQRSVGLWILGERTFSADTPGIAKFAYRSLFVLRSYATFPHPNVLGGYIAALLPPILQLPNNPINKASDAKKLFCRGTAVVSILALVSTFSRSAWVAATAALGKFFVPAAVVAALAVGQTMGFSDETVVVREQLNQAAVAMFLRSPVVGAGLGNFLVELPKNLVSRDIYFLQPVHNIYLLLLAETGIVGFSIFVWLIFRVLRNAPAFRHSVFILLFLGLVDHYPLTLQQGQLLLTILLATMAA